MVEKEDLQMIIELAEKLKAEMEYSTDDLDEMLGKPKIEATTIEVEEDLPTVMPTSKDSPISFEMDDEDDLEKRIKKLRGM